MRAAALILAAGSSSRLGRPKQLVLVEGEPVLRRTARIAGEAGFAPVYVVLGAEQEGCRAALRGLDVEILDNPRWAEGMGSSLCRGVQELSADSDAVLLLVCDQPRLTGSALRDLKDVHERAALPMSAARYSGRLGVPAIFSRALFAELAQVTGDQGARTILAAHQEQAAVLDLPEAACDIDTAADLERLSSDG